jgi:hypothetical protein
MTGPRRQSGGRGARHAISHSWPELDGQVASMAETSGPPCLGLLMMPNEPITAEDHLANAFALWAGASKIA